MHELRARCPWDAEQTHRSLVTYLVEETAEVVEAIEDPDHDDHLVEELGDLLLQVLFHSEIAAEEGRFDIDDVARGIADKLIARHPYVFGDGEVPDDLNASWEQNKQREKGRRSPIEGIPRPLDTPARPARSCRGGAPTASHSIFRTPPSRRPRWARASRPCQPGAGLRSGRRPGHPRRPAALRGTPRRLTRTGHGRTAHHFTGA